MSRQARCRKWALRLLAVLLLPATAGLVSARLYLCSNAAARLAADQMGAFFGQTVTVASIRGALVGTTRLRDVKLYDPSNGEVYFEAQSVTADLSLWSALRGARFPSRMTADQVEMRLRFNRDGLLLTHLATPPETGIFPAIHVRNARIVLDQEGRKPVTLSGWSLDLNPEDGNTLTGTMCDPTWGNYEITGRVSLGRKFTMSLASKGVALTPAKLRSMPFVPPALWEQMEAEGPAVPLSFSLSFQPDHPQVRYHVGFAGLRVRVLQKDRPSFLAGPVRGRIEGTPEGFTFAGEAADPTWGKWQVAARSDAEKVDLRLSSPDLRADMKMLTTLPHVPASVWEQVRASGRAAVRLQLHIPMAGPDVRYRLEINSASSQVRVPSIDLDVADVAGWITVEDGQVTLDRLTGKSAGGDIRTSGDLDLRAPDVSRLDFDVAVNGLDLRELPAKWELPTQIQGKITGAARLRVTVRGDRVLTHGTGKGQIGEARLVGFPASPIDLDLHADGRRFLFTPRSPLLQTLLTAVPGAGRREGEGPPRIATLAERTANRVAQAAARAAQATSDAASGVGRFGHTLRNPDTAYLRASVGFDDADLALLIARLGIGLPFEITGKVSVRVAADIPVNAASDLRAYRLRGRVRLPHLIVAGVELSGLQADVVYRDGTLRLERLSGSVPGPEGEVLGGFGGSARVQVVPRGDLSFDVDVTTLPVERLARLLPPGARQASGSVTGHLRASVPLDRIEVPAAWRALGRLRSRALAAYGLTFTDVTAGVILLDGEASVKDLRGQLNGAALTGLAALRLSGGLRYDTTLSLRGLDPARNGLLPAGGVLGTAGVNLSAQLRGTLQPLTCAAAGEVGTRWLRVLGVRFEELKARWAYSGDRSTPPNHRGQVELDGLRVQFAGGSLSGNGTFDPAALTGRLRLDLAGIEAGEVGKLLGAANVAVRGTLSGSLSAALNRQERGWSPRARLQLESDQVTVSGVPARRLSGEVRYREGKAWYHLEGETLGGKVLLDGKYPPPPASPVSHPHGWVRVEGVQLGRLWAALRLGEQMRPLQGVLQLSLPFRHDGPRGAPVAKGRFEIRDLRWRDAEVSDRISGDGQLSPDGVTVRDLNGHLGGGMLRASGGYRFNDASRNWFNVRLSQAEASQLAFFASGGKPLVEGRIDVSLRGQPGPETRGTGAVMLHRGKVAGVDVSEWRVPVEFSLIPGRGSGELTVRESSAQVGTGRAQVRASVRWDGGAQVDGSLALFDAALRPLAGMLGDVSSYARGRVTGRADFTGSNVRSLLDINANVKATLHEAQPTQIPVLRQIAPYLIGGSSALEATSGELSGRLSRGIFRISELTLENALTQVLLSGSITDAGRLDLDVTAQTSRAGVNPVVLRLLTQSLPAVGPVPVGLVLKASDLFAERVVHLRVSGTVRSPRVQVEPIRLLSEQAVRFFLTRAVRNLK